MWLFVPTIVLSFLGALAMAPAQAEAVAAQPQHAGSASGLMSGVQMVIGAAVVQLIGFSHDGTPYPMFFTVIACTGIALWAMTHRYAAGARLAAAPA